VLLDEAANPTVTAALEALPGIEQTAQKFLPIIPVRDHSLLNACLFLRARFDKGVPIGDLKNQIVQVYGARGRNFANLCSAGYLEKWLWPLYEELKRTYPDDPAQARATFQALYNNIVMDLPWTEFVSTRATGATVTAHISSKMNANLQNGVKYLNIHGLGEDNVQKVLRILPEIEKATGAITAHLDNDKTRIFVRLEMP
jgi:hypothetical protein